MDNDNENKKEIPPVAIGTVVVPPTEPVFVNIKPPININTNPPNIPS